MAKSEQAADKMRWILLLGLSLVITYAKIPCSVKEVSSGGQRPCRFPFIIGRKRYDSCTDYKDPDGKKWCSTRTSNHSRTRHVHVGRRGFCGHCPEECAEKEVGPCVDYARDGFGCVDAERCNDECEVIPVFLDGDELTENFNVRASQLELGCESGKTCSGYNEVCCKGGSSKIKS